MSIVNAFTCTGAYAVLIMSGLKRVESCGNDGMCQLPMGLSAVVGAPSLSNQQLPSPRRVCL